MKWVGQHIWNLVSRFYSYVYFHKVPTTGSDPDKFLAIDSDNKLVYRTGSNVLSDIGAGVGTITGVTITTDSGDGSKASDTSGSADFTLVGTSGVGVTNSGTEITVTSVPGEIDHNSLLNRVAAEHYRWDTNISATATINASNIPTLNQDTTGTADRAINLVASTSTAVALGIIELGHASDTTIARSASGVGTIEGKKIVTEDKQKMIRQFMFTGTLGTTETYMPWNGSAENTNVLNGSVSMLMPTAGKLLKIHMRAQRDHSGQNTTFTLKNWDANEEHTSPNASILCSKTATGPDVNEIVTFDFTSSLDSGVGAETNAWTANELITISITNQSAISSSCKYFVTAVMEMDWSSY